MSYSLQTFDLGLPEIKKDMKPFIKWPGGKERELKYFREFFPHSIHDYAEPFLGGGAVYFAMNSEGVSGQMYTNDFSKELIDIYQAIRLHKDIFFDELSKIANIFEALAQFAAENKDIFLSVVNSITFGIAREFAIAGAVELTYKRGMGDILTSDTIKGYFKTNLEQAFITKTQQFHKLTVNGVSWEDEGIESMMETALKTALYGAVRDAYNDKSSVDDIQVTRRTAYLFFIREFCFSSMMRFNSSGQFNVPYGGQSYNGRDFKKDVEKLKDEDLQRYLKRTVITCLDFEEFLMKYCNSFDGNDFIFVDPPYDSEFSDYDGNAFGKEDHLRLANLLSATKAKVMIVIKNTEFIYKLYESKGFYINSFGKTYNVNFYNRNRRDAVHLIITNYPIKTKGKKEA